MRFGITKNLNSLIFCFCSHLSLSLQNSMNVMTSHRNSNLDWIRCVAILLVITVHTWSLANVSEGAYPLLNGIYDAFVGCGVPLFLMISGGLQLVGESQSLRAFYVKRFKRLLIPFFFWATLIYVLSSCIGKYAEVQSLKDGVIYYLPFLLENKINMAYWYVPLMFVLYLLSPFLQTSLQGCSRSTRMWLMCVWLCVIALRNVYPELYVLRYTSELIVYLGFYVVGFFVCNPLEKKQLSYREMWVVMGLFIVCLILYVMVGVVPTFWRAIMCITLLVLLLNVNLPHFQMVQNVSRYSYAIYLFHMVFIPPLYVVTHFDGGKAALWQCCLWPVLTSVVVLLMGYFVCWLLCKCFSKHQWLGIN